MLAFDAEKCRLEVGGAATEDLLDRVTAYRNGFEPEAVAEIERELHRRGVPQAAIVARAEKCQRDCLFGAAGIALSCSRCRRPAVAEAWGWHRLWGYLPVFPRRLRFCEDHKPQTLIGG